MKVTLGDTENSMSENKADLRKQVRLEKFLQKSEKGELRKKFSEDVTLKGKGLSHICLFFQRKRIRNGNNNNYIYICSKA